MTQPIPESIGPYRVLRAVARGGMAEVFEVEDVGGERFALKLLHQGGSAVPRFAREYEALTRLNHPNVVRVYDYGLHGDAPWMTMELLHGTALQAHLKAVGRPGADERTQEVIRISILVAEALGYIHGRGLVHRDLKSDNVVILADGRVKLLDFGTAHIVDALQKITQSGEFIGTFAYAAPEQLAGGVVDRRSDLYALGVLLYRLCTGQKPFDADDPVTLARLHSHAEPRRPRSLVPSLPEPLEALIILLLAKKPTDRPARASEVVKALRGLAQKPPSRGNLSVTIDPEVVIGRDVDLREVVGGIESSGPGALFLVEGAEGSNRIRFVRAVSQTLHRRQWIVFSASLRDAQAAHDLMAMLEHVAEPFLAAPPPELVDAVAGLRAVADLHLLDERSRATLRVAAGQLLVARARGAGKPILLAVQGLHVASPAILDLLRALRADVTRARVPVRFIGGVASDVADAEALIAHYLPHARRHVLGPMSIRAVSTSIAALLHRRLPPADLARRVWNASGGQPQFVEEVVRDMVASGVLEVRGQGGNRIDWVAKDRDIPVSPSARSAMERELRRVSASGIELLDAMSIAGEEASLPALARVLCCSIADLEVMADRLVTKGWLAWVHPGGGVSAGVHLDAAEGEVRWLGWDCPLIRKLRLESMRPFRRRFLERALAVALGAECASPKRVQLLIQAGLVAEAARIAPAAGTRLVRVGDAAAAAQVLSDTLAAADGLPDDVRAELSIEVTQCLLMVRPTDPAVPRSLSHAERLARDPRVRARLASTRARVQLLIGHYRNYRKHLLEAWDLAESGPPALAAVLAGELARANHWAGMAKTAADWFAKAVQLSSKAASPAVVAQVRGAHAQFLLSRGEVTLALDEAGRAIAAYEIADAPRDGAVALAVWGSALRALGRFSEGLSRMYDALPVVRATGSVSDHIELLLSIANVEVELLRLGRAQEVLDELDAIVRPGELLHLRLEARLVRGKIALASGRHAEASEELRQTHERARAGELLAIAEQARALYADTLWQMNRRAEAREEFRGAVEALVASGDELLLAEVCAVRARAFGTEESAAQLFAPAMALLSRESLGPVRMERLIAIARREKTRESAYAAWYDAATFLNQMAATLDEVDRSAMRVHPWARAIVQGLK